MQRRSGASPPPAELTAHGLERIPNSCYSSPFRGMNVSPTMTFVSFVTSAKLADVESTPKFEVQEHQTDLVVARRDVLAEEVVALSLEDAAGLPIPAWTPGAHIDLVLNASLVRQYSLCGSPTDANTWRIAVL